MERGVSDKNILERFSTEFCKVVRGIARTSLCPDLLPLRLGAREAPRISI
jgi:hypothetical protein